MKMPLSEILDRYTITKLKSERTNEDVSDELRTYKREIDNPDYVERSNQIVSFIDRLYGINGQLWDTEGPFAPLHRINPVRLTFIRDHLCAHFGCDVTQKKPFKNLSIIDIGCGGGLICEPLSTQQGAKFRWF